MADIDERFYNPDNYVNRELSWLEFNYRVLSEARDKNLPLFERLKFLSITSVSYTHLRRRWPARQPEGCTA